jgi:hypothetical protein
MLGFGERCEVVSWMAKVACESMWGILSQAADGMFSNAAGK